MQAAMVRSMYQDKGAEPDQPLTEPIMTPFTKKR